MDSRLFGRKLDNKWVDVSMINISIVYLIASYSSTVPDLMCRSSRCSEMEIRWRFFQRAKIPVKRRTGRWKFFRAVGEGVKKSQEICFRKSSLNMLEWPFHIGDVLGAHFGTVDWIHQTRR